jgi:protein SCO1
MPRLRRAKELIYAGFTGDQRRARVTGVRPVLTGIVGLALGIAACAPPSRQYELRGQVLAVDRTRQEITIKHGDIRGFMPGMTMPFRVRDGRLLDGRSAGDLVTATLVVEDADAFLSSVERTGHAPLTEAPPPVPRMDLVVPGEPAPDVSLLDETGAPRRLSDWRGRALAVTFTYTRCPLPDFCPRMDRQFAAVQREVLADASLRDRVRLLSVSIDPVFDTPEVLAGHARRAGADPRLWQFMTGDPGAIRGFASRFGVSILPGDAGATDITHNLRTAIVGPDGTVVRLLSGNDWTPAELIDALRRASA